MHVLNTFLTSILYFILLNQTHYHFYTNAPYTIENTKFWPVFGYFVASLRTFWCPFYRHNKNKFLGLARLNRII